MAAKPPARISVKHDQIINWLVLNPDKSLRSCADFFGYSQAWLSTLIHSDAFQKRLKEVQGEVRGRVAQDLNGKLKAVADIALDKLGDMVAEAENPEFILDAADKVLHRLGYAPASARNPGGPPQAPALQANFFLTADVLRQAAQHIKEVVPEMLPAAEGRRAESLPIQGELLPRAAE